MTVQHFFLDRPDQLVTSTYLSTIVIDPEEGPIDHPGGYTVQGQGPLSFELYHGRMDADVNMDDWGFVGPTFNCLNLIHDPDRILLQHCDAQSLELAKRLGIANTNDTITLDYHDDMVVVPQYRDGKPAYFGDHSVALTPGAPDARCNPPDDHPQERGKLPPG